MAGNRTLLVASTGGHLDELVRLRPRLLPYPEEVEWATFASSQTDSLLEGETVHQMRYVPPRGYAAAASNLAAAAGLLRDRGIDRVVSTGSGIAIPVLAVARAYRRDCHYIESAARPTGPSMTGKVVSRIPGVASYNQYDRWANDTWTYGGSVFDEFDRVGPEAGKVVAAGKAVGKAVVTLGTMRTYGFRRAVERLLDILPQLLAPDADVLWQVGCTDVTGLPVAQSARDTVPTHELRQAMNEADLVIAHAGVGSALTALGAGRCPVLLPRREASGEHVDDHQLLIADELDQRGLSISRDPDVLTPADLVEAMARQVVSLERAPAFRLRG